jgi:hypothetical protein
MYQGRLNATKIERHRGNPLWFRRTLSGLEVDLRNNMYPKRKIPKRDEVYVVF